MYGTYSIRLHYPFLPKNLKSFKAKFKVIRSNQNQKAQSVGRT
jgi:hypothetical protein